MTLLIGPTASQFGCPYGEDYRPCTCYYYDGIYDINCDRVLISDIAVIFRRRTSIDLGTITILRLESDDEIIPADLIDDHRALKIDLKAYPTPLLRIDPQAFRSSKNYAQSFQSSYYDIGELDFNFLDGFDQLYSISFDLASNVHLANWTSLPPLRNLTGLGIGSSRPDLNEWTTFPNLIRGLKYMILEKNQLNDEVLIRIMNWAEIFSSE